MREKAPSGVTLEAIKPPLEMAREPVLWVEGDARHARWRIATQPEDGQGVSVVVRAPRGMPEVRRPMLYDCFPFFNELDLLEIRLHTLKDVVDRFVLVEAAHTFTGKPKPLHYQRSRRRFRDIAGRIIHVVVKGFPPTEDPWDRERWQRNAILFGLQGCAPDDVVLISDADEIPDPQVIPRTVSPGEVHALVHTLYYYSFHCRGLQPGSHTRVLRFADLSTPEYARRGPATHMVYGGWHFSFFGGGEAIREKIASYSHQELNTPHYTDPRHIARCQAAGEDLFGRAEVPFEWVEMDDSLPAYVLENRERFRHFEHPQPPGALPVPITVREEAIVPEQTYWQKVEGIVGPAWAADFAATGQKETRDAIEAFILAHSDGNTSLLDAGCNTGIEGCRLFSKGYRGCYVGVDSNQKALWYAARNLEGFRAELHAASIELLTPAQGTYDIVLTKDIIEHCPDYRRILAPLAVLARRTLMLSMFVKPGPEPDGVSMHPDGYYLNRYNRDGLFAFVVQQGFDAPECIYENEQDVVYVFRRQAVLEGHQGHEEQHDGHPTTPVPTYSRATRAPSRRLRV